MRRKVAIAALADAWRGPEAQLVPNIHTAKKFPFYVFLEKELRGLSPNFHIHVFVSDLCIPRIGPHIFSCRRIGRTIVGIYKSLTDTWMWKLRLKPHNSFPGNICFKFSVLCRWSALVSNVQYSTRSDMFLYLFTCINTWEQCHSHIYLGMLKIIPFSHWMVSGSPQITMWITHSHC